MGAAAWLGRVIGIMLAPFVFLFALVRGARAFHPDGVVYRADVFPAAPAGDPLARAAARLAGPALVRLSAAVRRAGDERPDVLGLAIRFGAAGDQDLLLATFDGFGLRQLRRATATTDTHDYLANDYRSVARYRLDGAGAVTLHARGRHAHDDTDGASRDERLARAAAAGDAVFHVEAQRHACPGHPARVPLVELRLVGRASVPSASLRFSPLRDGRGLHAIGFYAGLRWAAYPASRLGRRLRGA